MAFHAVLTVWSRSIWLGWHMQPSNSDGIILSAPLAVKVGEAFFWCVSLPIFGPWQIWGDNWLSSIVCYGATPAGYARLTFLILNSALWAFVMWHLGYVIIQRRRPKPA